MASRRPGAAPRLFTAPFVLTCVASVAFYLTHQMVLVALPRYVLALGGDKADAGTLTLAFAMTALLGRLPVAWAIDRWGRARVLTAGMLITVVSALLYSCVHALPWLFAVRSFHGCAMALVSTSAAVIVAEVVPKARSGEGMGIFGMGRDVALALGPILSLSLVAHAAFGVAAGIAVAGTVLGCAIAVTSRAAAARRPSQHAPARRGAYAFEAAAALPAVLVGLLMVAHGSLVTFLPLLGNSRHVGNPGVFFTANAVVVVAVRVRAGALSDRRGRGYGIVPGMLIIGLAMGVVGVADAPWLLAAAGALYGLGSGLAQPALMALVGDRIRDGDRARAMMTFYTGWELGIGLGAYALGFLLEHTDFRVVCWTAGLIAASGALVYLGFAPRRAK